MNDWPLLLFTLALQAASGCIFITWVANRVLQKTIDQETLFKTIKYPLATSLGLIIAGLGTSVLHLGMPSNAMNIFANLSSSWLSREILFTSLFFVSALATIILAFRKKQLSEPLCIATIILGAINVYVMAAVYANTIVIGWDHINTYVSFYGTTIVLGATLTSVLMVPTLMSIRKKHEAQTVLGISFLLAIMAIVVAIIFSAAYGAIVPGVAALAAGTFITKFQTVIILRWFLAFIGVGLLGYTAFSSKEKVSYRFVYIAFLAVMIAEVIGRYVFYSLGS